MSSTGGLLRLCYLAPPTLRLVIISFRPAWLARALLSFKRAQSSGNDWTQTKDKRHPLRWKEGYVCNFPSLVAHIICIDDKSVLGTSSTVWLTKAVDIAVSYPVPVVTYTSPACPADASWAN